MNIIDFSNTLRNLRKEANLTQQQLADRIGVVKSTVAHYESGDKSPSYDTLIRIAKIYGVSIDYLFNLEKTRTLDLSGLTDDDIVVVKNVANALKEKNRKIT